MLYGRIEIYVRLAHYLTIKTQLILRSLSNAVSLLMFPLKPFRNRIAIDYLRKFVLIRC